MPVNPNVPSVNHQVADISKAKWGKLKGQEIICAANFAYNKILKWKRNVFLLPSGQAGKSFIEEMTKVMLCFTSSSYLESVALTMVMIMGPLLLQKPSQKSKCKDHIRYLAKRLEWWKNGDLDLLVREGEAIQQRLDRRRYTVEHQEKVFVRLMLQGKISAALRWVGSSCTSAHSLDTVIKEKKRDVRGREVISEKTVLDILRDKHPVASSACENSLLSGPKQRVEDVIYESIDGELIQKCAKRVEGAAGPSGTDADGWRRILCSKQFANKQFAKIADTIAATARKMRTRLIDPETVNAYTACRLIPLDKKPGVRPVGIGEVLRRIIGKAVMAVTNQEIVNCSAPIQVCAGLPGPGKLLCMP